MSAFFPNAGACRRSAGRAARGESGRPGTASRRRVQRAPWPAAAACRRRRRSRSASARRSSGSFAGTRRTRAASSSCCCWVSDCDAPGPRSPGVFRGPRPLPSLRSLLGLERVGCSAASSFPRGGEGGGLRGRQLGGLTHVSFAPSVGRLSKAPLPYPKPG